MIVVTMYMHVRPEKRTEWLQTIGALVSLVREETGCVSSRFYLDVENDDAFCLLEAWATQEEMDKHLRSSNCGVLLGAMQLLSEPPEITFHTVSATAGIEAVQVARNPMGR
jgi:quinol monooxygenase YgiN